ncbi:MAG: peptidylprolyl isomerase [Verrucomicrobia bacterium]|jgi:FKBP-type peptidyl-prolyl cis-trans isomerase SlyD|nr:peptidylprolyl isomerase [Verrucomicrobiota bacterium]
MKIQKNKVVSIDYKLTGDNGQVLDSSEGREPLAYLHGNGNLVSGLEEALEGKAAGDALRVSVPPEKGYGLRDESRMVEVSKDKFQGAPEVKPGMQFRAQTPQGLQIFTVSKVAETSVTLDGNHPLAGATLNFDVTVRDVRDATSDEVSHGHVHGPGGHHH